MALAIEQDSNRYRQIVRGKVKQNLRKYISNGELIGRRGKDLVSIPLPQIELPHFRFGGPAGGVGQGEGEPGTPLGRPRPAQGSGQAGDQPGEHLLEVELTLDELAEMLGEELALPRIQPKGKHNVEGETMRYTGVRRVGPESLRCFKRTYREALKRQLASGMYNAERPAIVPIRDDKRYRSWKVYPRPDSNAIVFYLMDISGSMSERRKRLVRLTSFWLDTWLRAHYKRVSVRYLVHDYEAREVDEHTFYHINTDGGTRISSAYQLCQRIIAQDYPPEEWNLYAFHFSDGENSGNDDDQRCLRLLRDSLLPALNLFGYGQVENNSEHLFRGVLTKNISDEKLATAQLNEDNDIYAAIKSFLGKGL